MCAFCGKTPKHNGGAFCQHCGESVKRSIEDGKRQRKTKSWAAPNVSLEHAEIVVRWKGRAVVQWDSCSGSPHKGQGTAPLFKDVSKQETFRRHGSKSLVEIIDLNKFVPWMDGDRVKQYKRIFRKIWGNDLDA